MATTDQPSFLENVWGWIKQVPITMRPHDPGGGQTTSIQQMWDAWPANKRQREDAVINFAEETGAISPDMAGKFRSRAYPLTLLPQLEKFYGLRDKAPLSQTDPGLLNQLYPETKYSLWKPPTAPESTRQSVPGMGGMTTGPATSEPRAAGEPVVSSGPSLESPRILDPAEREALQRQIAEQQRQVPNVGIKGPLYTGPWPPTSEEVSRAKTPAELQAEYAGRSSRTGADLYTGVWPPPDDQATTAPRPPYALGADAPPAVPGATEVRPSVPSRATATGLAPFPRAGMAWTPPSRADMATLSPTDRLMRSALGAMPTSEARKYALDLALQRADEGGMAGMPPLGRSRAVEGLDEETRASYDELSTQIAGLQHEYRRLYIRGNKEQAGRIWNEARHLEKEQRELLKDAREQQRTERTLQGLPTVAGTSRPGVVAPSPAAEPAAGTPSAPARSPAPYGDPAIHAAIIEGAQQREIDPVVALSYFNQESNFHQAHGPEIGIGQFTRHTARERKLDLKRLASDVYYNIDESLNYLADLKQEKNGNLTEAVKAYNGGGDPKYLEHVARHYPMSRQIFAEYQRARGSQGGPPTAATTPGQAAAWRAQQPGTVLPSGPPEVGQMTAEDQASYTARAGHIATLRADHAQAQEALQLLAEAQARNPKAKLAPRQQQWQHRAQQLEREITRLEGQQSTLETESRRTRREETTEATKAAARPGLVRQEAEARESAVSTERGKWVQAAREAMGRGDMPGAEDAMMRSRIPRNEWPAEIVNAVDEQKALRKPLKGQERFLVNPHTFEVQAADTRGEARDKGLIETAPEARRALQDVNILLRRLDNLDNLLVKAYAPGGIFATVQEGDKLTTLRNRLGGAWQQFTNRQTQVDKDIRNLQGELSSLAVSIERALGERGRTIMDLVHRAERSLPVLSPVPDTRQQAYRSMALLRSLMEEGRRALVPGSDMMNPTPTPDQAEQKLYALEGQQPSPGSGVRVPSAAGTPVSVSTSAQETPEQIEQRLNKWIEALPAAR